MDDSNPYRSPTESPDDSSATAADEAGDGAGQLLPSGSMTRLELAALVCKGIALWLFSQAAVSFGGGVIMLITIFTGAFGRQGIQWDQMPGVAVLGMLPLMMLIVGLFLWFKATWLASKMVSDDPTYVTLPTTSHENALVVAFAATGVLTLVPCLREWATVSISPLRSSTPTPPAQFSKLRR